MIRQIALDMFRGNFPFPPNFHLLLICVGESAALHHLSSGEPPFLDVYSKKRVNKDF